jgi:metal-dependent HD superfamily phosphatase/phosphodiesterase
VKEDRHKHRHMAIAVTKSLVGKILNECWQDAKRAGLRIKVRSLDGEQIRRDNHDDDSHVSVVVSGGIVRKAWIG